MVEFFSKVCIKTYTVQKINKQKKQSEQVQRFVCAEMLSRYSAKQQELVGEMTQKPASRQLESRRNEPKSVFWLNI